MRRRAMSVLLVVPGLLLSACSGSSRDDGIDPVTSTAPTSAATPTSTPTPTQTPLPTTTQEAAKIAVAVLGTNAASNPDEQAVVDTWMTYWSAVVTTYNELEPDPGLDVARGKPLTDVLDYLNELKTKKERSVGWTRENVLAVKIAGSTAVLRDCAENFNFTVDAANKPTEDATPFYSIVGQLKKSGDGWVITSIASEGSSQDCRD